MLNGRTAWADDAKLTLAAAPSATAFTMFIFKSSLFDVLVRTADHSAGNGSSASGGSERVWLAGRRYGNKRRIDNYFFMNKSLHLPQRSRHARQSG
jgi:hypothetical protein